MMVRQAQGITRRGKQKGRLRQWHKNTIIAMENGDVAARMHAERTKVDSNRSPKESIRSWMFGALNMRRKLKEYPQNDIWRYFNG